MTYHIAAHTIIYLHSWQESLVEIFVNYIYVATQSLKKLIDQLIIMTGDIGLF